MVHIQKDYNKPPIALLDSKWDFVKQDVLTNENHKAKSECYRNSTLEHLVKLYNHKCACCERKIGYELEIDHYRPKKARNNGDINFQHSGYYWLTYEWSNLIPLCSSCNQSKSNYFPLKDNSKRITNHNHLLANNIYNLQTYEEPLFINPEIELQPEKHFKYLPDGKVEGRTLEGKTVVKFYNLNSRTKVRERRYVIASYILKIRTAIGEYFENQNNDILKGDLNNTFREILNNGKINKPLSLLHIFIRNYFNIFIAKNFPNEWQNKLINLFNEYYQNIWKK